MNESESMCVCVRVYKYICECTFIVLFQLFHIFHGEGGGGGGGGGGIILIVSTRQYPVKRRGEGISR